MTTRIFRSASMRVALSLIILAGSGPTSGFTQRPRTRFHLQEATIAQIQQAIRDGAITTQSLVEMYLRRIKAYNGTCVSEP